MRSSCESSARSPAGLFGTSRPGSAAIWMPSLVCLFSRCRWIYTRWEWVMFHYRLMNTRVVSDVETKLHKF